MEQFRDDAPDPMGRLRRRVASWLRENAIYLMANFAGLEAFLPPQETQDPIEHDVIQFRQWLEGVTPQDFANYR